MWYPPTIVAFAYYYPLMDAALLSVRNYTFLPPPSYPSGVVTIEPLPGEMLYMAGFPHGIRNVTACPYVGRHYGFLEVDCSHTTNGPFFGSSGSPAFNSRGEVVGIVVRGKDDCGRPCPLLVDARKAAEMFRVVSPYPAIDRE